MAVEDPGTLTVTCDECGDDTEMNTTAYGGSSTFGIDDETLEENGWKAGDGDDTYYPKCAKSLGMLD